MRSLLTVLFAGSALFAGAAFAHARLPASLLSLAILSAGVLLSVVASQSTGPLAIASGAAGSLLAAALAPKAPLLAGAALVAASFAARAARAGDGRRQALHLALSLAGGAAGALCALTYAESTLAAQAAAVVVSGLLASAPLLLPAEDDLSFSLGLLVDELDGGARVTLARAAHLSRQAAELSGSIDRDAEARVLRSLRAVLSLGRARRAARAAAAAILDRQIAAHVAEIERLLSAAAEAGARARGLEDQALSAVREGGEGLEARATALAEVDQVLRPGERHER